MKFLRNALRIYGPTDTAFLLCVHFTHFVKITYKNCK